MTALDGRTADVAIVGGGLAGLVAARDLAATGLDVVLVEGRDRLGGRTLHRPFAGTDVAVEMGGTYFVGALQDGLRAEIERYGLAVARASETPPLVWHTGGERRATWPVPPEQIVDAERAAAAIIAASRRIAPGTRYDDLDLDPLDGPYGAFLDRLRLPAATRDLFASLPAFFAGAHPERLPLLHVVDWVAQLDHSVWAQFAALEETFADGTGSLVRALADDARSAGAALHVGVTVDAIARTDEKVTLATSAGTLRARRAIVTAPVETWERIAFEPPLPDDKWAAIDAGHRVRTRKLFVRLADVAAPFVCAGTGSPLQWLSSETTVDGDVLCAAFVAVPEELDPDDLDAVQAAVAPYLPGARVVAVDHEPWNDDRFSQGISFRPRVQTALQRAEGALHFAGADVATHWPAWMAGAIESATETAAEIRAALRP